MILYSIKAKLQLIFFIIIQAILCQVIKCDVSECYSCAGCNDPFKDKDSTLKCDPGTSSCQVNI